MNGGQPAGAAARPERSIVVPEHLRGHPDRERWNARYRQAVPDFAPHALVQAALSAGLPDGPVLDLACGRSGSALALAEEGRSIVAVDISDHALSQLAEEAARRGLAERIELVLADVSSYKPEPERFALVLATYYWDANAFRAGRAAVRPAGLIGWEALAAVPGQNDSKGPWRVPHGELSARLPAGFDVISEHTRSSDDRDSTMLLARRAAQSPE